ncbi:GNAT family N-acetyltransferase [Streptomyces sp. NBC_01525]|uniref:GNAT family N-acetyltransferase n=1 Tax=Streptomyces sp. NBC_01525 TaxID=2903893 RepID=UPI003869FB5F
MTSAPAPDARPGGGAAPADTDAADGVRIRRATTADAPAIARVHRESRRVTMPYLPPQRHDLDGVITWIRDHLLPGCTTWVAERGTDVIGYAAVRDDVLEDLYLHPDELRRGLGTRLLAAALAHRPDGLTLHVFEANTGARAFYARHGFTTVASGSDNMEGLPELTLHRGPAPAP